MSIERSYSAHDDVGQIKEIYARFVDFKLFFLEQIEIKQLSLFLVVNSTDIRTIVFLLQLHFVVVFYGIVDDVTRGASDVSEIVQLEGIVAGNN